MPRASRPPLDGGAATAGDGLGEDRARHDSRRYQKSKLTYATREQLFALRHKFRLKPSSRSDQRRGPRGGSR
jgi:hypothetical protein